MTQEQKQFIEYSGVDSVILDATAGSGKTFSCVNRLKTLLERGVNPESIIFFSFTNDAVNELKSRIGYDTGIKITTIHSFTQHALAKMGKNKAICTFNDFLRDYVTILWRRAITKEQKEETAKFIEDLYENETVISAAISAYKLEKREGIKAAKMPYPEIFKAYSEFLKTKRARDFSDMLIETYDNVSSPIFKKYFYKKYEHVFVDEYQDTSSIQMRILLAMDANQYYLTGDECQSIYGFSGANCALVKSLLTNAKNTIHMTLSINFRSDTSIVSYANNFSTLFAKPQSKNSGYVHNSLIAKNDLKELLMSEGTTVLARTNRVIKDIELWALNNKIPLKYFNYFTQEELTLMSQNQINERIQKKLRRVTGFSSTSEMLIFIYKNQNLNNFVTSIHKSKGREFDNVIVVNSIEPGLCYDSGYDIYDYSFIDKETDDIDIESRNVHYVASTRPKHTLHFMVWE